MSSTQSYFYDPHLEARAKLDEEISQLEARLISLRSARNALAPIARLQPEILQEIFFLFHDASSHKGKGTLLLTWISHRWRELAHDTASLWSYIDFTDPEWVKAALTRTKGCELEYDLRGTRRKDMENLRSSVPLTLGNLFRIRKLKVVSRFGGLGNDLGRSFTEGALEWLIPAPRLVELHLQGLSLPWNSFSGSLPSLHSLHLQYCAVDWNRFPFPRGLKSLYLSNPHTAISVADLMNVLRVVGSDLETLELHDVFDSALNKVSPVSHCRYRLEKLKDFKMGQPIEEIVPFLDQILLPGRANVELTMDEWNDANMLQSLVSFRDIIGKWPIDRLEIDIVNSCIRFRIIETWLSKDGHSGSDEVANSQTNIEFELESNTPFQLIPIFNILPIHPLKKVAFSCGSDYSDLLEDPTIFNHVGKLRTILELRIEILFMQTFLNAIEDQVTRVEAKIIEIEVEDDLDIPVDFSVPRDIITFHGLQVLEIYYSELSPDDATCIREDLLALRVWLGYRARLGLPLETLIISGLRTPPISWMKELFDGVIGKFRTRDLTEVHDAYGDNLVM